MLDIALNGGDLAVLLRAGGWKSAAFRCYLEMCALESKAAANAASVADGAMFVEHVSDSEWHSTDGALDF